jgi:hypothetical protein
MKVPQFEDTDLFLSYLRSYLYEDPVLTLALLAPGRDEIRGADAVANRINERVQRLVEEPGIDDCVRVFEESIAGSRPELALVQGIDVSPEDVSRAQDMFNEACYGLLTGVEGDDRMRTVVGVILANLQSRRLMAVASSAVKIKRGAADELEAVAAGGETWAKLTAEFDVADGVQAR